MNKRRMIIVIACTLIMAFAMTISAYADTQYTKFDSAKTGKIATSTLSVRAEATADSDKRGTIKEGTKITIWGEAVNDKGQRWYKLTYKNKKAYVRAKYVETVDTLSYVVYTPQKYCKTTGKVNVRANAGKDNKKLGTLKKGTKKIVTGYKKDANGVKWYRVKYGKKHGYISSKCAKLISKEAYAKKSVSKGKRVVNYALKFKGVRYVYGGSSLKSGVDCSGFVRAIFKHFGYSLPHNSYAIEKYGKHIKKSNKKPGDVICYGSHVAIYIGNGKVVHASSDYGRVRVDKIGYNHKSYTVRRIAR